MQIHWAIEYPFLAKTINDTDLDTKFWHLIGKLYGYGLLGIAFETQETTNLKVTKFVNLHSHKKWIEAIVSGKESGLKIWSRSADNGLNPSRISGGHSRTTAMNISFMIWFNFIFILSCCLK